jgi:hydrogenase-4 component F
MTSASRRAPNTFVGFDQHLQRQLHRAPPETGRLTPVYLRFYHAMYQIAMFA